MKADKPPKAAEKILTQRYLLGRPRISIVKNKMQVNYKATLYNDWVGRTCYNDEKLELPGLWGKLFPEKLLLA